MDWRKIMMVDPNASLNDIYGNLPQGLDYKKKPNKNSFQPTITVPELHSKVCTKCGVIYDTYEMNDYDACRSCESEAVADLQDIIKSYRTLK